MKIIYAKDYQDMSRKAANIISAHVILQPNSTIALATGSTPLGMYRQLIDWYKKDDIDFSQITTFNLDEYIGLGKEHPKSYYRFMYKNFFNYINIPESNVNIPNGMASNVEEECCRYDKDIAAAGGIDFQLLWIGRNGHIGFNEPASFFERDTHEVKLTASTREANARFFNNETERTPTHAISMGIGTIMQTKKIMLLCSGEAKADILYRSLYGKIDPQIPASILQMHANITIVGDKPALSRLPI